MYKMSIARKLFREAYKDCHLRIGQTDEEEFYVTGKDWLMWFDAACMEKEIKGELISLCGDLPKPGTAYLALPASGQQMEVLRDDLIPSGDTGQKAYNATRFFYSKNKQIGTVVWSNEASRMMIIDNRALILIQPDEKEIITGPIAAGRYLCWKGDGRAFYVMEWSRGEDDDEVERFLSALEKGWLR